MICAKEPKITKWSNDSSVVFFSKGTYKIERWQYPWFPLIVEFVLQVDFSLSVWMCFRQKTVFGFYIISMEKWPKVTKKCDQKKSREKMEQKAPITSNDHMRFPWYRGSNYRPPVTPQKILGFIFYRDRKKCKKWYETRLTVRRDRAFFRIQLGNVQRVGIGRASGRLVVVVCGGADTWLFWDFEISIK